MQALSIRQPWAWLIVKGYKDIENRKWWTSFRGKFWVHASKGMTRKQYEECREFVSTHCLDMALPPASMLPRGGIVGWATLTDCVKKSESKWFAGPFGFELKEAGECNLVTCKGTLGFFQCPELAGKEI